MNSHPALPYNQLVIEANRLGRRMKQLHEVLAAYPDDEVMDAGDLAEIAEKVTGIGAVLAIIRDMPNANLNVEALAAIRWEVEHAANVERQDWAVEVFEVDGPGGGVEKRRAVRLSPMIHRLAWFPEPDDERRRPGRVTGLAAASLRQAGQPVSVAADPLSASSFRAWSEAS